MPLVSSPKAQVLQLDQSGQPRKWISINEATTRVALGQVGWSVGELHFTLRGGINRYSGLQSCIATPSIFAPKTGGARGHLARVPSLVNRQLFRRDLHTCAYCNRIFSDGALSRDHIIPRSRGGADTWSNVVTACLSFNSKKKNKLLSECGMVLLFQPYTPSWAESLILQNPLILEDQLKFLLELIPEYSRIKQQVIKQSQAVNKDNS